MITDILALVFIVVSIGLFWYLFRGLREEDEYGVRDTKNPIIGNFVAVFVNLLLCGCIAYWFWTGNVMIPQITTNATYTVNITALNGTTPLLSTPQYYLGMGGAGMMTVSAMNQYGGGMGNLSEISFSTYNIVYLQMQDAAVATLYVLLAILNAILFSYYIYKEFFAVDDSQ